MTRVRGLSWQHPRGHAPLVAAAEVYSELRPDITVEWTPRAIGEFAAGRLDGYLSGFDVVAIDHPTIGEAAANGWIHPLDDLLPAARLQHLAETSIDGGTRLYTHAGRVWALPVDAATHSTAFRSDRVARPPSTWDELAALARTHRVGVPLSPMSTGPILLSLLAQAGAEPFADGSLAPRIVLTDVLGRLADLAAHLPPACLDAGAIQLLRTLATTDDLDLAVFVFGYSTYGRAEFPHRVEFAEIPALAPGQPRRATVGGVGLALLAQAPAPREATEFIEWACSAVVQCGVYAHAGGQPAHIAAWHDPDLDSLTNGFLSATRPAFTDSYTRPRAPWFPRVQADIGRIVHGFLRGESALGTTVTRLRAVPGAPGRPQA